MKIKLNYIKSREILDSRGKPTVEVEISAKNPNSQCQDIIVFGASPSGASCGKFEAHELRDNDEKYFFGSGVCGAVKNVNTAIKDLLFSMEDQLSDQFAVDSALIALDNTENKSSLGANALIATSMAIAKLNAKMQDIPLWKHINNLLNSSPYNLKIEPKIPNPFVNILNGGLHADNNLAIQEFMIIPSGINSFKDKIRACSEVFFALKNLLKENGYNTNIGDEGGFAPNFYQSEMALDYLLKAIEAAGYKAGSSESFTLALDVAASSFLNETGAYIIDEHNLNDEQMIDYLLNLCKEYPIASIEDALGEEDFCGWAMLTKKNSLKREKFQIKKEIQLVGDDLFVTNPKLFEKGIGLGLANSILIKPNQIGTLSETLKVIEIAIKNNYQYIISHRSGETEDVFISHLAVGSGSGQIKTGSVSRSERVAKYNELIRIEEEILDFI